MSNASDTKSLRLSIIDLHIHHLHEFEDLTYVTLSIFDETKNGISFPGSIILPSDQVSRLKLRIGDEFSIVMQKSKSIHHIERVK